MANPDYPASSNLITGTGSVPNLNTKIDRATNPLGGLQQVANCTFSHSNPVALSNGTDSTQNSRFEFTTTCDCTDIRLVFPGWYFNTANSTDTAMPNSILIHVGLEYPASSYCVVTAAMQKDILIQPGTSVTTDPVAIFMPKGTRFWVRTYTAVSQPPTGLAASAITTQMATGLANSTQYFYKVTALTATGESGPTSEVSATTSAGNLSIQLTWAAANASVTYTGYKIYRSTTTGTEVYLTTVYGPGLNFTDSGQFLIGTGAAPAAQKWANNNIGSIRDGVDGVSANGTIDLSVGGAISVNSNVPGYGPLMVVGKAANHDVVSVIGVGDSILAGFGTTNVASTCAWGVGSFVNMALGVNTGISYTNLAVASTDLKRLSDLHALNYQGDKTKRFFSEADYCVLLYGHNDDYGDGASLATIIGYLGEAVHNLWSHGVNVYVCTMPPLNSVTSDQWRTVSGQLGPCAFPITGATNATPIVLTMSLGTNGGSTNYAQIGDTVVVSGVLGNTAANGTWVLSAATATTMTLTGSVGNGNWSAGGTQIATNTTREAIRAGLNAYFMGAAAAGAGNSLMADYGQYVAGVWDLTAAVEVNANGTAITRNATTGIISNGVGGYWPGSLSTICSGTATGTQASGLILNDTGATFNATNPDGYVLVLTSGTGAGQYRNIVSHTGTTLTVATAFSPVQVNGSTTYAVVDTSTIDGIHPNNRGAFRMAQLIQTGVFVAR